MGNVREENESYQLTLSKKQAQVLREAMEFFARCGMGQLGEIYMTCYFGKPRSEEADGLLDRVKEIFTGLPRNAYYSLTSHEIDDKFRIAWDINQVLRYQFAGETDPDRKGWHVWNYKPELTSTTERKLPTLTKTENTENANTIKKSRRTKATGARPHRF